MECVSVYLSVVKGHSVLMVSILKELALIRAVEIELTFYVCFLHYAAL